ncbi:glycosyltransferase [Eubacterium oxidoreducens]|uniref:Glycosyltransferase involved in cell wall bisynthesis n=1 Tax=Eubacterium oxidoreducens TaxID=1732 RepID=A0A1G6BMG4_EUBOX|nr:glycosyltransferase [Eubacterium oxidoreducens]SDB21811.1 Glycosyltransferase involved in cell wall bisynthesis [Eubacterium oxidoreducens]
MKKIKIVYILHGLARGGIESFVIGVMKHLPFEEYDISLIMAVDKGAKQQREDEVEALGVKIYRTNDLDGIRNIMAHYIRLKKLLIETGPYDVVHANMDLFNGVNLRAAKKAGIPIRICHAHIPQSQNAQNIGKPFVVKMYQKTMRRLIRKNATIKLGCSASANEYFYGSKWQFIDNCKVVYNGIDVGEYRGNHMDKKAFLMENHLPVGKTYIVTVGRMSAVKNPLFAIDVMYELHQLNPNYHYIWVGDGEMRAQVKQRIEEKKMQDYVWLLGVRNDIADILHACDCFLMTSIFEAFATALVEAQVSGVPCICSDTIPRDADLGRCVYISLKAGEKTWAKKINEVLQQRKLPPLLEEKMKQMDVTKVVQQLEQYYKK